MTSQSWIGQSRTPARAVVRAVLSEPLRPCRSWRRLWVLRSREVHCCRRPVRILSAMRIVRGVRQSHWPIRGSVPATLLRWIVLKTQFWSMRQFRVRRTHCCICLRSRTSSGSRSMVTRLTGSIAAQNICWIFVRQAAGPQSSSIMRAVFLQLWKRSVMFSILTP